MNDPDTSKVRQKPPQDSACDNYPVTNVRNKSSGQSKNIGDGRTPIQNDRDSNRTLLSAAPDRVPRASYRRQRRGNAFRPAPALSHTSENVVDLAYFSV